MGRQQESIVLSCYVCGKAYRKYASQRKTTRGKDYCSTKCYREDTSKAHSIPCSVCGALFVIPNYRVGRVVTCSTVCHMQYEKERGVRSRKIREQRFCPVCGKSFSVYPNNRDKKFCGSACYGEYRRTSGMSLGENNPSWRGGSSDAVPERVKSREWKQLADSIREERGGFCEVCGATPGRTKFPVHHRVPYAVSQDNSPGNLLVVCHVCHPKLDAMYAKYGIVY